MKAIYASKLYRSSKRKSKIQAALQNPVNMELVKQLSEYLDEEYIPEEPKEVEKPAEDDSGESIRPSESSGGGGASSGGQSAPSGPDLGELTEQVETERAEALEPDSDNSVEESTRLSGQIIEGSTSVDTIADASDEIKGLLNSRQDSTGVVRVAIIDNVLHVYFDEGINLNEVMEPAISLLNAAGYSALNFKKLSRSDNAMTFDIDEIGNDMKPISEMADNA